MKNKEYDFLNEVNLIKHKIKNSNKTIKEYYNQMKDYIEKDCNLGKYKQKFEFDDSLNIITYKLHRGAFLEIKFLLDFQCQDCVFKIIINEHNKYDEYKDMILNDHCLDIDKVLHTIAYREALWNTKSE